MSSAGRAAAAARDRAAVALKDISFTRTPVASETDRRSAGPARSACCTWTISHSPVGTPQSRYWPSSSVVVRATRCSEVMAPVAVSRTFALQATITVAPGTRRSVSASTTSPSSAPLPGVNCSPGHAVALSVVPDGMASDRRADSPDATSTSGAATPNSSESMSALEKVTAHRPVGMRSRRKRPRASLRVMTAVSGAGPSRVAVTTAPASQPPCTLSATVPSMRPAGATRCAPSGSERHERHASRPSEAKRADAFKGTRVGSAAPTWQGMGAYGRHRCASVLSHRAGDRNMTRSPVTSLTMKPAVRTLALALGLLLAVQPAVAQRQRYSLDPGWRHVRGDAPGAEATAFDDRQWRMVDLPHDWSVEGPSPRMRPAPAASATSRRASAGTGGRSRSPPRPRGAGLARARRRPHEQRRLDQRQAARPAPVRLHLAALRAARRTSRAGAT